MKSSTEVAALVASMVKAQTKIENVGTDSTIKGAKYTVRYASLPMVREHVVPALNAEGILFSQELVSEGQRVGCITVFRKGDQWLEYGPLWIPASNDAQGFGSAASYGRRYALVAALGLAPDEDDDGTAATRSAPPHEEPAKSVYTYDELVEKLRGAETIALLNTTWTRAKKYVAEHYENDPEMLKRLTRVFEQQTESFKD